MPTELARLERRHAREQKARQEAEHLLELKSRELFEKNRELEKLSNSLEKLVAKRTSQMQKARDEALTALQVKSDFIANMSHELRTPMNGVLGVLTLLSDEKLSQEQQELVRVALSSGKHLLGVINDILDFSKIEAKKLELELSSVQIEPYFHSVCAPFALDAKKKGIEFRYDIDIGVPKALVTDPLRFTQIISNLLSNAIKFTDNGGVFLSFTPFNSKGVYRLTVADSGIGIGQEHIDSVFAAFEQADNSITRDFGGTGLGMNITKNLVEMFKGQILVESELGEGTTFHVDISFAQGEENSDILPLIDAGENPLAESNILLVEDNPVNQMVAMKMLSKWDCHVDLADDGLCALQMLETKDYQLVLMDLQMPNMGGIEATKRIRASKEKFANIPIVAMTAHNSKEHMQECYDAGMQHHISKPIERDSLQAVVLQYLSVSNDIQESDEIAVDNSLRIPGIDLASALERVNGDWPLLYSLIARFLTENTNLGNTLKRYLADNDQTNAIILLHKVKGGAANLGIAELSSLAGDYETLLAKQQNWPDESAFSSLQMMVDNLNKSMQTVDNPSNENQKSTLRQESQGYVLQQLKDLQNLVNKDLFAAEDILKDLLDCELSEGVLEELKNAQNAMNQFDTPMVSAAIAAALVQLG
ncbi:response regulator [Brumicola blandensis]|uniref:Sensory/regulatory protein RpfC n=1 Tax=Brumicola blandensis TaxID=3075611 RepID=A0AAW8R890_9ALTE|nr:response regulator [Alteromonas sp. W409]MDT0584055.1 response regulator [Alteromonas sp. W409]